MKRVSIIGATVHGNHGAEAMLAATIGRIRDANPDTQFEIFSYYPKHDRALITIPGARVHSSTPATIAFALFPLALILGGLRLIGLRRLRGLFPASIQALEGSTMLIDLAGVSFVDGREKFLPFNILTILPAMLLGVPVIKFAQAMGSFHNPVNRFAARIFLGKCAHVFGRGEQTMEHLRQLGLSPDRFSRAADMAFVLYDHDALTTSAQAYTDATLAKVESCHEYSGRIVGICPSSVIYKSIGDTYISKIADYIADQLSKANAVLLFPNATRADQPEKFFNNDLPLIKMVIAALPEGLDHSRLILVERDVFAVDIKRLIAVCDMVVVSRFHAMVGALAVGVPPLVIGWSHKYQEVMADFGLKGETFSFDLKDEFDLNRQAGLVQDQLETIRMSIQATQERVGQLSQRQVDIAVSRLA